MRIDAAPDRPAPYAAAVLAVVLGAVGAFGYGGPLGFAPLAALGGLLLAPIALRPRAPPAEWLVLVLLVAWAAFSLLWAPATGDAAAGSYEALEERTAVKLPLQLALYGLLAVGASRLPEAGARRAMWAMTALVVPWSLLLADGLSGGRVWTAITGLFGVETAPHMMAKKAAEGSYALAVLIWPVLGFLLGRRRPVLALATLGAAVVGMALLSAWSAVVATVAGLAAMLLVGVARGVGARALGLVAAAATVLTPVLVSLAGPLFAAAREGMPASWAARTGIWTEAVERVFERPFGGWGLDASRSFGPAIPLHPHDASLQLWLELGVVGVLIAAAFWLLLSRRVARLAERRLDAGQVAAASFAAYFMVGALSFGVWQEWWLAAGALTIAACSLQAKVPPGEDASLSEVAFRGPVQRAEAHDFSD